MADLGKLETPHGAVFFRELRASDLRGMLRHINLLISEDAFLNVSGKPYSLAEERDWLERELKLQRKRQAVHVVAEAGGRVIGLASVHRQGSKPRMMKCMHVGIFGIAVSDPEFRGCGVGEKLARTVLEKAGKIGIRLAILDFSEGNRPAQRLYKKVGFKEYGCLPEAYIHRGKFIDKTFMYKSLLCR